MFPQMSGSLKQELYNSRFKRKILYAEGGRAGFKLGTEPK